MLDPAKDLYLGGMSNFNATQFLIIALSGNILLYLGYLFVHGRTSDFRLGFTARQNYFTHFSRVSR